MRLLVVEDDVKMAALVRRGLSEEGAAVDVARSGEDALWMAAAAPYDALVLDVMLPGIDGFQTCRRLRDDGVWTPVLLLTARDSVEDRVAGLDGGADDYLTKPFSFAELSARLRALVRRGQKERPAVLEVGDLRLDPATRQTWRGKGRVELSTKEFALLEAFMRRPGEVLSRLELLEHAWDFGYENRSNVIDVYVRYLREKVDRPFGVKSIETVRGAGYRLREDGGRTLSRVPVRIRLTLAFTAVMAGVLVAVGLFVYTRVSSDLDAALDNSLRSRADDLAALAGGGRLSPSDQDRLVASDESLAQLIGPGGRVVYSSAGLSGGSVLSADELARARSGPLFVDRDSVAGFDERMRLLARPTDSGMIVVGSTREDREEALSSLGAVLLTGGPIALLLAALAGYGLASAALRPVGAMRDEAAEISRLGSGRRLTVPPAGDELSKLGATLNEMLERLERSAERERGFVASASHELRTPLTLLKAELELALREGRTEEELREAVASAAGESDRLVQLAEDLLVLARADEGRLPVRPERLDAAELLQSTARRFQARANDLDRRLRIDAPDGLTLYADRLRAEQALGNLVDNALRHASGTVELQAERSNSAVRLHVRDRGPGFDPALDGLAFERFTRGDRARSRGGTGLGLAIVDAVARSHGGRAAASEREDGRGADVWIELPHSHADLIHAG